MTTHALERLVVEVMGWEGPLCDTFAAAATEAVCRATEIDPEAKS